MKKSGLAHLCHHDRHYEFCYDFDERVKYIKENKPKAEIPTRLKYFQIMPEDRLPKGKLWDIFVKARAGYGEAEADYEKEWAAHDKTWAARAKAKLDGDKTWDALFEAEENLRKAWAALNKAWDAYYARHYVEIDRLHDELFPDCPWNEKQQTMFPEKNN